MTVFCVDPSRPPYRAKVGAKVLVERAWFDDGHQYALKDELVKLDDFDAEALSSVGHVSLIGKPDKND